MVLLTPVSDRLLKRRSVFCLRICFACLLSWGVTANLPAQDAESSVTEATNASPSESLEKVPLPEAFSKSVPTSLTDLRDIQNHVTGLIPQLTDSVVNLRIGRAQGTGVIVSADGLVLSAAHVTGPPGRRIVVVTADGQKHEGLTLGRNTTLDGSMLRIESDRTDWPHRPIAADPIKPGDWCLTLGHPGGFQEDRGQVLRLGRVIEQNDWLIQSDCELIGGDSGGPLFNMHGEVIGINTRIGESTQYNFHVPVPSFTRDWNRFLAGEDFKSHSGAYLGIGGIPAEGGNGLLIQVVESGTPAQREGLQAGDILQTFQGVPVQDLEQLIKLVGEESPGRTVKLTILRDGESQDLSIRLGMRWNR